MKFEGIYGASGWKLTGFREANVELPAALPIVRHALVVAKVGGLDVLDLQPLAPSLLSLPQSTSLTWSLAKEPFDAGSRLYLAPFGLMRCGPLKKVQEATGGRARSTPHPSHPPRPRIP